MRIERTPAAASSRALGVPVSVEKTTLPEKKPLGKIGSRSMKVRGRRAVSAAELPGKGSRNRSVLSKRKVGSVVFVLAADCNSCSACCAFVAKYTLPSLRTTGVVIMKQGCSPRPQVDLGRLSHVLHRSYITIHPD